MATLDVVLAAALVAQDLEALDASVAARAGGDDTARQAAGARA